MLRHVFERLDRIRSLPAEESSEVRAPLEARLGYP